MKKLGFILIIALLSFNSLSQDTYFGKNLTVSIGGVLRPAFIYQHAVLKEGFDFLDKDFNKMKVAPFSYGFMASLTYNISGRHGIGVDVAFNTDRLQLDSKIQKSNQYKKDFGGSNVPKHSNVYSLQSIKAQTMCIIPKYVWSIYSSLPVGLVQSVGIGFNLTTAKGSTTRFRTSGINYDMEGNVIDDYRYYQYDLSGVKVMGVLLDYSVKLNFPISRFMALYIEGSLRIQLPNMPFITNYDESNTDLATDIKLSMMMNRGTYLWDLRAGVSFFLF